MTEEEIRKAVLKMKLKKIVGIDGIPRMEVNKYIERRKARGSYKEM